MSNIHYLAKQRQKREQHQLNAGADLATLAYTKLVTTLTRSGNIVSDQHRESLMMMLGMYSLLASGKKTGRYAFDLSVGGAKSQSVVAWCAALAELQRAGKGRSSFWQQQTHVSVLVTAAKVEALCDTKRDLIAAGVPAEAIGIWHSYSYNPSLANDARRGRVPAKLGEYASEPSIDDENPEHGDPQGPAALQSKQFCLIAHNRLRGWSKRDKEGRLLAEPWMYYRDPVTGRQHLRTVAFHDEACFTSDVFAISSKDLRSALGALDPFIEDQSPRSHVRLAFQYIRDCIAVLHQDCDAQKAWKVKLGVARPAQVLAMPDLPSIPELEKVMDAEKHTVITPTGRMLTPSLDQYITAIRKLNKNGNGSRLISFLKIADKPLRVIQSSGGAIFHCAPAIPDEVANLVVLDACFGIRELEKLDKSITTFPTTSTDPLVETFDGRIADYGDVQAFHLRYGGGRSSLEASFSEYRKEHRLICNEVIDVIKGISLGEGILVFLFKQRGDGVDMEAQLLKDLTAAGVDTDIELVVTDVKTGETRKEKRIAILTWGNETSLSEYCWAANIICAGVLQKPPHVLEAHAHAAKGGLLETAEDEEVKRVRLTEAATLIHQAAGRGTCRIIRNGKAQPMRLWFIHWTSGVKKYLREVMRGIQISRWQGQHLSPMSTITTDAADKIISTLRSLPLAQTEISLRALKKLTDLPGIAPNTWKDARDEAADELDDEWYIDGALMKRRPSHTEK
jgi:hypothetical protein